jgi:hypothetical protein
MSRHMDRAYIESNAITQRYLAGTLSEEESLAFEDACAADTSLADELNRDLKLKAGLEVLARRGELRAVAPKRRSFAGAPYAAAASLVAFTALGACGYLAWQLRAAQAPRLIGSAERLLAVRGEPVEVALPLEGMLGLSIDASALSGGDVDVELRSASDEVLWKQSHRVGDDGTIFVVLDPARVPAGSYAIRIAPRNGTAPLVYRMRTVPAR